MKLKFLNHASVLIDCDEVKILTDPWYSGTVFNEGWSLMYKKEIDITELDFNFLWYSHEHPDHFSPRELKKIPPKRRKDITILFQNAPDQKVKSYCEGLGYRVVEMQDCVPYKFAETTVMCGQEGGFDSWLKVKHKGKTLLNINDCRLEKPKELRALSGIVGPIDVLLTQFGWANWVGNDGDMEARKLARKMVVDRVDNQVQYLSPKFLMPFASFSWFSHEENIHCNLGQVTLREFHNAYPNERLISLFPKEEWEVGRPHDTERSLVKWDEVYSTPALPHPAGTNASYNELLSAFDKMCTSLQENNVLTTIENDDSFPNSIVELTDYPITGNRFAFNPLKGIFAPCNEPYDVKMSSLSLIFIMRHPWGRGTLTINGRFEANYKTFRNFLRQTHIYYNNNIGKIFPRDIEKHDILYPKSFVHELIEESS